MKSLIEKGIIKTPFRFATNFPNEAYFNYFVDGEYKN